MTTSPASRSSALAFLLAVTALGCGAPVSIHPSTAATQRPASTFRATTEPATSTPASTGTRPLPNDLPTPPGSYVLAATSRYGVPPLDIRLTISSGGWRSWGPGVVTTRLEIRDEVGMGFAAVRNLYVDPCRWRRAGLLNPSIGPSVDDLVAGLAHQKWFTASEAFDVSLGGFPGRYLELTIDPDLDFATCDEGTVHSWLDVKGDSRYYQGPGQVEQFWILDVEGTRLVVEGSFFPQASKADRDDLARVIESVQISTP